MTAPSKEQALAALRGVTSTTTGAKEVLRSFIESTSDAELPVGEPEVRYERRNRWRDGRGEWEWGAWKTCTATEAQRVTGLRTWEVRRLEIGGSGERGE